MSLAQFFTDKCLKNLEENISLVLAKLSDPASFVKDSISGGIRAGTSADLGSLANFAGSYIKENSDKLVMETAGALGFDDEIDNALNLAYNLVALSVMAKNDLIFMFLKKVAANAIVEIKKKDEKILRIKEKLQALYNALVVLASGDDVWNEYVEQLRRALQMVNESKVDIQLVRNTLNATDFFLGAKFTQAKERLVEAKKLLVPMKDNPYLEPSWNGVLTNTGLPSKTVDIDLSSTQFLCSSSKLSRPPRPGDQVVMRGSKEGNNVTREILGATLATIETMNDRYIVTVSLPFPKKEESSLSASFRERGPTGTFIPYSDDVYVAMIGPTTVESNPQIAAIMAIPVLSKEVGEAMISYSTSVITLNALLDGFMAGYDQLQAGMPLLIKKYVLSLFDKSLTGLGDLGRSMALKLNGSESAIAGPLADFEPQPITVSVLTYKWAMDLNLIFNSLKMIPEKQLDALNLASGAVAFYQGIVEQLMAMDGMSSGNAVLIQEDSKEVTGPFESQMLLFLVEANASIVSAKVRSEILALGRAMLDRMDLAYDSNRQIEALLQSFIEYPLPDQALLDQMGGGIYKMLGDLGLDNALAKFQSGSFTEFFDLNGNTATTVGAALAFVALLKKCYNNTTNDQLNELEQDLLGQKDLLNISFSLNFDLAILKNLNDCLKLRGYSKVFNLQELFCALVKQNSTVNKALQAFVDVVSF